MTLGVYLPFFIFFTTAVPIPFCTVWAILTKVLHCIARFFFRLSLYHSPPQYSVTKHRQSLKVILHPTYMKELVLKMFLLNLTWSVSFLSSACSLLRESSNWEPSWRLETRLIPPPPAKLNIGGGLLLHVTEMNVVVVVVGMPYHPYYIYILYECHYPTGH